MNKDSRLAPRVAGLLVLLVASLAGPATSAEGRGDPFRGKLFPPNVILEHQQELALSKEQFTRIRKTVVDVQADIAEYEWDMREAYQRLMRELDQRPVSEEAVMKHADTALMAENEVKKRQMAMLVRVRNLLTEAQLEYLEALPSAQ